MVDGGKNSQIGAKYATIYHWLGNILKNITILRFEYFYM